MEKPKPPRFVGTIEGIERTPEQKTVDEIVTELLSVYEECEQDLEILLAGLKKNHNTWSEPQFTQARVLVERVFKATNTNHYRILKSDPRYSALNTEAQRLLWTNFIAQVDNFYYNFQYLAYSIKPKNFREALRVMKRSLAAVVAELK